MVVFNIEFGDCLLMLIDGFVDYQNVDGQLFGEVGICQVLNGWMLLQYFFDVVMVGVWVFVNGDGDIDDFIFCCIEMVDEVGIFIIQDWIELLILFGFMEWYCEYEIWECIFGDFSFLLLLLYICMEVFGLC